MSAYGRRKSAVHIGETFKTSFCGQAYVSLESVGLEPNCKRCIKVAASRAKSAEALKGRAVAKTLEDEDPSFHDFGRELT